jgi:hypothetical protein
MWRSEEISPSTMCFCRSIRETRRPGPTRAPVADATMILNFDVALRLQCGRQPRRGTRVAGPSMALRVELRSRASAGAVPAAGPAAALLPASVEKHWRRWANAKRALESSLGVRGLTALPIVAANTRDDGRASNGGAVSEISRAARNSRRSSAFPHLNVR